MTHRKNVLVTGGAGFIGSHLVDGLMQRGFAVTVFDNMSTGRLANIGHHIGKNGFRLLEGDVRNARKMLEAAEGARVVFHLAAVVDVQHSIKDPLLTNQVNVLGTLNLLEACRKADVELAVYASSCALYGDAGKAGIREDVPPKPISPYAASKLAAENYFLSFHKTYGLPIVCLRFFNIFGPRQNPGPYAGVVAKFVHRLLRGKPPIIYGDGRQSRDFLSVKDAVNACMLSLEKRMALGQVMNIGSGRPITINNLAELLIKVIGRPGLRPAYQSFREGEILHSKADIRLARRILGYAPTVLLKDGLRQYVDWVKSVPRH